MPKQKNKHEWADSNQVEDNLYASRGGIGGSHHHGQQKVTVTRSQLQGVMKSKLDIYNILTKEGQLYMPPMSDCTMSYIKDVLTGKKKVSTPVYFLTVCVM